MLVFPLEAVEDPISVNWLAAVYARDTVILKQLVYTIEDINQQTNKGLSALMAAAARGDNRLIVLLLEHNARPDQLNNRGGTALMYAAAMNNIESINLLISHKADVNIRAENGWTALTLAAAKGNETIVNNLLNATANPNIPDVYGWTPLMRAIEHDRMKSSAVLIRNQKTQLNRINSKGQSALHIAAGLARCDTVKLLIEFGADQQLLDFKNQSPLLGNLC